MKTFSIIVPVYYNELNLPETIPALIALEKDLPRYRLELVFVDDGSGDRSFDVLLEHQALHPEQIKIVKLTRNFGAMAAIQAGLTAVSGDCVGIIAADLQDPPELFLDMIAYWEKGIKAIFAVRQDREEPFLQKTFSNAYYSLVRKYAIPNYPDGGFDFLIMDRQVVYEINRIREKNTNLMALIYWLGFKPVLIPYVRHSRKIGKSRWTLGKKIKLFTDTFVSFSYYPIQILSVLGFIFAVASFLYGALVVYSWLRFGIEVRGWVPSMIVATFTAGLQMLMLGVLGEYLWRTLDEARRRPPYVIDEIYSPIVHENEEVLEPAADEGG